MKEELFQGIQEFQSKFKARALLVFLVVHAGLAMAIFAVARASVGEGWDTTTSLFVASAAALYVGFLLAVFFIVWPMLPWIKRAKQVEHWTDRLMRDLPTLIDNLPKIVAAVEHLILMWNQAKQSQYAASPAPAPKKSRASAD